jgi:hypothetical protein
MALSDLTFAALKSAVSDWLARSDLTDAQLSDCVLMFEAEANRILRVRNMETSETFTTTSGVKDISAFNMLAWRSLTWEGSTSFEVEYVHPSIMRGYYPNSDDGVPHYFTIEEDNLTTRPVDDSTSLTLRFWQPIPALTSTNTTNWLLTKHPDTYLAGTLYCAYKFLRDVEGAMAYKQLMNEGFGQIRDVSEKSKAPTAIHVMGSLP